MKNTNQDNEHGETPFIGEVQGESEEKVGRTKIVSPYDRSFLRGVPRTDGEEASEKAPDDDCEPLLDKVSSGKESYLLTDSQKEATESLIDLMGYYFDPDEMSKHSGASIPINCNALLLGPTGSGKTIVVGRAADHIGAEFRKASLGTWVPIGGDSSAGGSTLVSVVEAVCQHKQVVFFLDELDKLYEDSLSSGDWGRSVRNDVIMLFGRDLNINQLAKAASDNIGGKLGKLLAEIGVDGLKGFLRDRLFLVAAGTWQKYQKSSVLNWKQNGLVGFSTVDGSDDSQTTPVDHIIRDGDLPEEVLRRFYPEHICLEYPSEQNLREIVESDNELVEAMEEMGIFVDYEKLLERMKTIGMTAVSGFKTSMMLDYRKWRKRRAVSM